VDTANWNPETGHRKLETDIRRLIIRAPNPLGDALMALPAMAAVRAAMAGRQLIVAASPGVAPLFSEITVASPDVPVVVDKRHEATQLRELRADAIVLLTNSFRTAWVARQAAIPQRWGYRAHARSLLLTRAVARPRTRVHQSEYYLQLVRELGLSPLGQGLKTLAPQQSLADSQALKTLAPQPGDLRTPPSVVGPGSLDPGLHEDVAPGSSDVAPGSSDPGVHQPTLRITPATRARTDAFLAQLGVDRSTPLVGLAPGAAYGHAKRWPPQRVAELVARLTAGGATCLLVGAEGDRSAGREIESVLPPGSRVVDVIGRTDLRLFAGLLASCHAFVSNDSGAMHLAAAAGVPVAAIFGPTDERVTAPLGNHDVIIHQVFCRPCMLRDCPIDHRCMRGISVDTVFAAVTRRLTTRVAVAPERGE
jgi:ADP-heptose:LPS heptosyltransferase